MAKEHKVYPWNQLVDLYLADERSPFLDVLKFVVVNHRYFKNKSYAELADNFDTEPEDFFQDLYLELDRLFYLRQWKARALSDSQLNVIIRGFIRNRLIDRARKRKRIGRKVALEDEAEIFEPSEIQKELEARETFGKDESEIIKSIKEKLNERQKIVFLEYHRFAFGKKGRDLLALEQQVSVKTIESDIRKIKDITEKEFVNHFPYLKKHSKKKQEIYERV